MAQGDCLSLQKLLDHDCIEDNYYSTGIFFLCGEYCHCTNIYSERSEEGLQHPSERSELGCIPNLHRLVSAILECKSTTLECKVPQFDGDLGPNISHKNVSYDKNHILRQTAWTEFFRQHFNFFLSHFQMRQHLLQSLCNSLTN